MSVITSVIVTLMVLWVLLRLVKRMWLKMHHIAGLNPRPVHHHSHLVAHVPTVELPQSLPPQAYEQDLVVSRHPAYPSSHESHVIDYWQGKYSKVTPLKHLPNLTAEKIHAIPAEALVILEHINDKMARYTVWRAELTDINETWLTEKQYAINRLINESVPEAVNHYDQLARFDPHRVSHTKVNGDMTASDILIDVLQEVDNELDSLIDELYQQTVQRLASMHRYVKTRVQ